MNSNSFLIKGWTITLVSALFALAAKDANINYVLITYIALPAFWVLDGFFIAQERQYRELYNVVAKTEEKDIDFSMNASSYAIDKNTWGSGIFSKTLNLFYGVTLLVTLIVMFLLKYL